MNGKKSFKIEFTTTAEAMKFIDQKDTNLGGIRLSPDTKEQEVDPTV